MSPGRFKDNNDLHILLLALVILGGSALVRPSTGPVHLFGLTLPSVCMFQHLTSYDCPGCGLTRSLIFALHGQFYQSYLMHLWGIPTAILLLFQLPYRVYLLSKPTGRRFAIPSPLNRWVNRAIFLSLLLPWAAKTAYLFYLRYI